MGGWDLSKGGRTRSTSSLSSKSAVPQAALMRELTQRSGTIGEARSLFLNSPHVNLYEVVLGRKIRLLPCRQSKLDISRIIIKFVSHDLKSFVGNFFRPNTTAIDLQSLMPQLPRIR
jgi:hypothetical protein